jgi:hypothetical protein
MPMHALKQNEMPYFKFRSSWEIFIGRYGRQFQRDEINLTTLS